MLIEILPDFKAVLSAFILWPVHNGNAVASFEIPFFFNLGKGSDTSDGSEKSLQREVLQVCPVHRKGGVSPARWLHHGSGSAGGRISRVWYPMPKENPQDTELPGVPGLWGEEPSSPAHPRKTCRHPSIHCLMVHPALLSGPFDILSKQIPLRHSF